MSMTRTLLQEEQKEQQQRRMRITTRLILLGVVCTLASFFGGIALRSGLLLLLGFLFVLASATLFYATQAIPAKADQPILSHISTAGLLADQSTGKHSLLR